MKTPQARYLVFAASLRNGSLNHHLADLAASIVRRDGGLADLAQMREFDCPSYDGDEEIQTGVPEGAQRFKARLEQADGLIIASPEFNASMPGVLKNVIDWVSRFRPQPFRGKQCLVMSASPSMAGGNRGLWALRIPLEHLGTRVYPDMFSLAKAHEMFGEDGKISSEIVQEQLESTIGCFMELVEATKNYPGIKAQWIEFLGEKPDPATERVEGYVA
jgi:chromate reductase